MRLPRSLAFVFFAGGALTAGANTALAQPLGTFTWQLQPYCNRVTVNVRQDGAVYTLDGTDDQCGAAQKAPLVGVAAPNPDGSIGFGLNIVAPSGQPVPVQARITVSTLSGTWRDSGGQTGTFAFGGALPGLPPRPTPTAAGDITEVTAGSGLTGGGTSGAVTLSVDPTAVQSRVTTACPAGQAIRTINQDGTAVCQAATGTGGGDVTAVTAGLGLLGGGDTGDVTLHVMFGGDGALNASARSDHEHAVNATSVGIGPGALPSGSGNFNTAVGALALGASTAGSNSAVGTFALQDNTIGSDNAAFGSQALGSNTTGDQNTALGEESLQSNTTGFGNTAIGESAMETNVTGQMNTAVGQGADVASANLTNATAIGANTEVSQNDSLVLGSINGINGATADTRVGVGLTAPSARLHLRSQDATDQLHIDQFTATPGYTFVVKRARGTPAAPAAVVETDFLMTLRAYGHNGTTFNLNSGAAIVAEASENATPTANGARWRLFTTANGQQSVNERVRIEHNGNVGIGTTTPADLLHVNGDLRVGTTGTNGCVKRADGNVLVGACSSDARFKRDVTPFSPALQHVAMLQPVHFYWRADAFPAKRFGETQAYGLVAQEVETVLPELVSTDAEGFKTVDYTKLPLLAIQAIKELEAENEALRDGQATLERRLAALEAAMATRRD